MLLQRVVPTHAVSHTAWLLCPPPGGLPSVCGRDGSTSLASVFDPLVTCLSASLCAPSPAGACVCLCFGPIFKWHHLTFLIYF